MKTIRIGTRGSDLALYQANLVKQEIENKLNLKAEIIVIKTTGDKNLNIALHSNTLSKGLFTKEIEEQLETGEIDFAVHSLKDLPVELDDGFLLGSVIDRVDVEDVIISNKKISNLRDCDNFKFGTSSPRRVAQLISACPNIKVNFEPIRGNVDTRINKMKAGAYDAIIMAKAGILRLGLEYEIAYTLPLDIMLPAPGQGAIGIETHKNNKIACEVAKRLESETIRRCTDAERLLLQNLGGGCALPFGCFCTPEKNKISGRAFYSSPDFSKSLKYTFSLPYDYSNSDIKYHSEEMIGRLNKM